ncbi:MAG: type III-B CRISPR module RAMP protein Cmr6, partial [Bacteroidia bacterium]|nr:type III-B CRISPR module RAMP protein Cmr6 [Bacteroidia bacterium]
LKACGGVYRIYKLRSRLVIGLGGADVREVGFTLHRHGFPYIPASSLKGLARAAAELIAKASEKEIHRVFGWSPDPAQKIEEGQIGKAVFWDAFPLPNQASLLELDVLNPHFPDYYRTEGTEPPSEWQSPIPIFFLAVPAGTKFIFCISGEEQEKAWDWLHTGLTEMGAGAKTTLGYGLWEKVSAASQIPLASKAAEKPLASQSPTSNTLSSPPKWKRTQSIRKGTSLYARILRPGPEKDELLVELWAEGYEGEEVLCKGIASHFTHAGFIEVEVSQPNPKLQVRFKRKL